VFVAVGERGLDLAMPQSKSRCIIRQHLHFAQQEKEGWQERQEGRQEGQEEEALSAGQP